MKYNLLPNKIKTKALKKILLLLILNIPLIVAAQNTPDFITALYFEDAIGNKDTLWVGYDSETDYRTIDFELGEDTILISTPFDTIFEVRVDAGAIFKNNSYYQTTAILNSSNCRLYYLEGPIVIEVVIANPPLKVSWNRSVWEDEFCTKRSIIQPNLSGPLLNIWDDLTYFAKQDSVFFTIE